MMKMKVKAKERKQRKHTIDIGPILENERDEIRGKPLY